MEPATEGELTKGTEIAWHFIRDDGTTYYIASETQMLSVEELIGLKPDGTSVLKEFLNHTEIAVLGLTMNEEFAADGTKRPSIREVIEDSVLYCPGQQYASCIDCCVLCDVKTKCPSCHRRVLVARILKQPATSSENVEESSAMDISEDISILPDIFNSGSSSSFQKHEEQDEDSNDSEIKITEIKQAQFLSIDSDTESTFSVAEDLHPTAALSGPSNVEDMDPPEECRIIVKPPATNCMTRAYPPAASRILLKPPATNSTTQQVQAKKIPHEAASSSNLNLPGPSDVEIYEPAAKKSKLESRTVTTLNISCRYIRIGSYAVAPVEQITLSPECVVMKVPPINPRLMSVKLTLLRSDLLRASLDMSKKLLILSIDVTETAAARIREELQMNSADVSGPWFNPNSNNSAHRKIELYLKDCHSADTINRIKQLLKTMRNYKSSPSGEVSANSRSSPSVVSVVQNRSATSSSSRPSSSTNHSKIIVLSRPPDVPKKSSCNCGTCHGKIRLATKTT